MASKEALCAFYESRCHAAAAGRLGIIVAVEKGVDIRTIKQRLDAMQAEDPACSFLNTDLNELIPPHGTGSYPHVDTDGQAPDENPDNVDWIWALKMGYARDRVFAYAECKAALMNANNLDAPPEKTERDAGTCKRVRARLETFESRLASASPGRRTDPLEVNRAKRELWERAQQSMGGARRQQVSCLQDRLTHGLTGEEIEAVALDPLLAGDGAMEVGKEAARQAADRDARLGQETFVSFVFAEESHETLVAAGATGSGIAIGNRKLAFPAYVTMHTPTGVLINYPPGLSGGTPPNSLMVDDAAALLCDIHTLAKEAGRGHVMLEHALSV